MSAADSNTSLPEKKSGYTFGHNETLLLISLYQKYEVFFSDVSYKKRAIWRMIADDMKKNGYSPSAITCENRWKCLTSFVLAAGVFLCRKSELFLAFRTNYSYSRIVDKKNALLDFKPLFVTSFSRFCFCSAPKEGFCGKPKYQTTCHNIFQFFLPFCLFFATSVVWISLPPIFCISKNTTSINRLSASHASRVIETNGKHIAWYFTSFAKNLGGSGHNGY